MKPSGHIVCNDACGCPLPCPGGTACRCTGGGGMSSEEVGNNEHKTCSCGQHCGCNPCNCSNTTTTATTGRAHCKCGSACSCSTCSS